MLSLKGFAFFFILVLYREVLKFSSYQPFKLGITCDTFLIPLNETVLVEIQDLKIKKNKKIILLRFVAISHRSVFNRDRKNAKRKRKIYAPKSRSKAVFLTFSVPAFGVRNSSKKMHNQRSLISWIDHV